MEQVKGLRIAAIEKEITQLTSQKILIDKKIEAYQKLLDAIKDEPDKPVMHIHTRKGDAPMNA